MSQIIDNVKVGNQIKDLLKKNGMTQSDLAEKLSISKSAVSQNLSGRSSFDIENLLKIAKLFNMSIEELIDGKNETQAYVSSYEEICAKGVEGFQQAKVEDLRIAEPDFYGKVLVDYVIEHSNWDMLIYLHQNHAQFTHDYFRRAEDVILKVILALLEHGISDVTRYFIQYHRIHGSIDIDDHQKGYLIWKLLDKQENQDIVKQLLHCELTSTRKILHFFDVKERYHLVSKTSIISIISRYQLINVLSSFLVTTHRDDWYADVCDAFLNHQFNQGLIKYIQYFEKSKLSQFKKMTMGVQKCILRLINEGHNDLMMLALNHRLFTNLTEVLRRSIEMNQNLIGQYIIENFKEEVDFRKIGEYCIDYQNISLFDRISCHLNREDFDYLLSYTKVNDLDAMLFLVKKGARLNNKHYNLDTFEKMNKIIDHLLESEEK